MNKLVVDTNVFLDVILARQPMCEASASVLDLSSVSYTHLTLPTTERV